MVWDHDRGAARHNLGQHDESGMVKGRRGSGPLPRSRGRHGTEIAALAHHAEPTTLTGWSTEPMPNEEPAVFRHFEELLEHRGTTYRALICGRPRDTGAWEAWIEFVPEGGGPVLRSQRETTQSNRRSLQGWAERLSRVYLEGALERTLSLEVPVVRLVPLEPERPHFESPAPGRGAQARLTPDDAVVNPFLLHHQGEASMRSGLAELSAADLRTVIWAYGLDDASASDPAALSRPELIQLITRAVRERLEGE